MDILRHKMLFLYIFFGISEYARKLFLEKGTKLRMYNIYLVNFLFKIVTFVVYTFIRGLFTTVHYFEDIM